MSLASGEIYHICNRIIEGRSVFDTNKNVDYFLENILVGNTKSNLNRNWRRDPKNLEKMAENPLAEIFCLILMPDHFHLLVRQLVDGGVAKLMQRSCDSFAKFFNAKHKRKGSLFMGRYKAVPILSDVHGEHMVTYIHSNALDIVLPTWRKGKLNNWGKAKKFLDNYKYSSLPVYLNNKNMNPLIEKIISRDFIDKIYKTPEEHWSAIHNWSIHNVNMQHLFLE